MQKLLVSPAAVETPESKLEWNSQKMDPLIDLYCKQKLWDAIDDRQHSDVLQRKKAKISAFSAIACPAVASHTLRLRDKIRSLIR